ncbi:MCE family protein [Nocardioides marmorisolisilvae]|uniref:MCE family protein n=1 Tax=Nocardioides marmorisolisilvae TaxID=1542737 RepID=A0A3N0DRY5_9ACTN|nr:MlaD family protein [Nocardioides marmorisolisilvae]RNL78398.1 MCE family protein [Nocardioides marmorisolisilvae]
MSRGARIRLWVFLVIGGLAVINAGARYAGLTDALLPTTYSVSVHLKESGGLFQRGEVTYRGFTVGRVQRLDFRTDGVIARIQIKDRWKIPADLTAEVHNRSAVGEQYLDLVPHTDHGPYLHDGSVIRTAQTTTPVRDQDLIVATDRLLKSIDVDDLATVVDESATAFGGEGNDLAALLTNSRTILNAAQTSLPATKALLRSGATVLGTQDLQARTIADYLDSLARTSGVLANRDRDVRLVLADGTRAARELQLLADGLSPELPDLLAHIVDISGLLDAHRDGIEETLVAIPWALASAQTPGRDGRAHFTFVGGLTPQPCRTGYIPAADWRSPLDPTVSDLPDDIGCRTPSSVPRGVAGH